MAGCVRSRMRTKASSSSYFRLASLTRQKIVGHDEIGRTFNHHLIGCLRAGSSRLRGY